MRVVNLPFPFPRRRSGHFKNKKTNSNKKGNDKSLKTLRFFLFGGRRGREGGKRAKFFRTAKIINANAEKIKRVRERERERREKSRR